MPYGRAAVNTVSIISRTVVYYASLGLSHVGYDLFLFRVVLTPLPVFRCHRSWRDEPEPRASRDRPFALRLALRLVGVADEGGLREANSPSSRCGAPGTLACQAGGGDGMRSELAARLPAAAVTSLLSADDVTSCEISMENSHG